MRPISTPRTLFLDSGVLIDGCYSQWSASKALLILCAQHPRHYRVVLADAVDAEVRAALALKASRLPPAIGRDVLAAYPRWRSKARPRPWPIPDRATVASYTAAILPALRHVNDLAAAVSAIQARPDWILSTNSAHWGTALAAVTNLRVVDPWDFLEHLSSFRP